MVRNHLYLRNYLKTLGVDPDSLNSRDEEILREAYNKSHEIRKFEIQLYWQRSTYFWTLQAAAFAGIALLASGYANSQSVFGMLYHYFDPAGYRRADRLYILMLAAIWGFGLVTAFAWLMVTQGSKVWQDNWERHVDALEQFFSGDLYKTYPRGLELPSYSVSKVNSFTAWSSLVLWIVVGSVGGLILDRNLGIIVLAAIGVSLFLIWFFDPCRMTMRFEQLDPETEALGIRKRRFPD